MLSLILAIVLAGASGSAQAADMPVVRVQTLAGGSVTIPRDTMGSLALFVIGFTRESGEVTARWSRRMREDHAPGSAVKTYQVAVIEDVPRLLRRFVVSQIEASVPVTLRATFLTVTEKADAWKKIASFENDDTAYLVLVGRRGEIRWRARGGLTEQRYQEMLRAIASAQSPSVAP